MSDTPITDAAEFDFSEDCTPEDNMVVASCDMRKLERKLNEANGLIAEAKTHLQEVDLPDEPIDIQAKRLRDAHDWQAGIAAGYERQIRAANETLRKLNDALDEANADRLRLLSFIKELNATKFAHGREYRSKCGKFLQALSAPPPLVVDRKDSDALAEAVKIMRVGICSAAMPNATEREIASDAVKQASEVLKTYHTKYPQ